MTRLPELCHCRARGGPCSTPATQEDLLCNSCREGCNATFEALDRDGHPDGRPFHTRAFLNLH